MKSKPVRVRRDTSMMYISKKEVRDVSNAINILDPTGKDIDTKICGSGKWVSTSSMNTNGKETADKCFNGNTSAGKANKPDGFTKLSDMFKADETNGNSYPGDASSKMGNHTSETISKDVSKLTREQHGVVSSAFAKAWFGDTNEAYKALEKKTEKFSEHNAKVVSRDVAALNREQHGVVSSAFAKAHEGAEIQS